MLLPRTSLPPFRTIRWLAPALLLAFFAATVPAGTARAQNRSETERRLKALQKQIAESEQRLSETAEAQRASEKQLQRLERRIAERSELVELYQRRLREIRREEDALQASLRRQQQQLQKIKQEYQRRATHAYKYGRLHDLALILAARSVNEMLVRVRYLRRFTRQRQRQLDTLRQTSRQIKAQRQALQQKRDSTAALLHEANQERQNLKRLRKNRRDVIRKLRSQQSRLKENLSQQQASAQQLKERLERMAAREARRSRRETEAASPERRAAFARLTGSFEQNKGSLPWPVEGVVTEEYGTHTNPVHGTQTPNPGVMIATRPQAEVRAIFEGIVTQVDAMPDLGSIVFVRHGRYLSLYSNFSSLQVSEGERVEAGQLLGRAGTDEEPRGAGVFFALFRDGTSFDPADWLRNR